jgi:hypothetical protein
MTSLNGQILLENNTKTVHNFLANIVSMFHGLVVLFVIITPFFDIPYFLILHFTFCVSLLVHWWGNSNVCSLSVLESQLRGLNYTESFTHKFIAPIYDISKTTWSRASYIITILLMSISAYKIYQSPKWRESVICYNNINDDPNVRNLPLHEKLIMYSKCVRILFNL